MACDKAEKNIEAHYLENYPREGYHFKYADCIDSLWQEDGKTLRGYVYLHYFRTSSLSASGQWSPISQIRAERKDTVELDLDLNFIRTRPASENSGSLF